MTSRPVMFQTPRNKSAYDRYEVRIDGISPSMLDAMCYDKFHEKWERHSGRS